MLVLSRLRDEAIMIGDDIEITIVDIRGDKVRLGISAPTRIAVHRKEVYEAIRTENSNAARAAGTEMDFLRQPLQPVSAGPPRNNPISASAPRRVKPAAANLLQPTARLRMASTEMTLQTRRRDGPPTRLAAGAETSEP